jgi:hypothetical protein
MTNYNTQPANFTNDNATDGLEPECSDLQWYSVQPLPIEAYTEADAEALLERAEWIAERDENMGAV